MHYVGFTHDIILCNDNLLHFQASNPQNHNMHSVYLKNFKIKVITG